MTSSDLGDIEYPLAEKPTWLSQIKGDPLPLFRAESILFQTKLKVGIMKFIVTIKTATEHGVESKIFLKIQKRRNIKRFS